MNHGCVYATNGNVSLIYFYAQHSLPHLCLFSCHIQDLEDSVSLSVLWFKFGSDKSEVPKGEMVELQFIARQQTVQKTFCMA